MGSPNLTEAIIEFQFEIDDKPIRNLNELMDQFRDKQLQLNEKPIRCQDDNLWAC